MADLGAGILLGAYRVAGLLALPVMPLALSVRAARGKEDRARIGERFGRSTAVRPPGRLVWIHAASVGETTAVLPLIGRMLAAGTSVLFTSVTVTSAGIAAARLPAGAFHQFAPLDVGPVIDRFLRHWRPDVAVFVESEQWPMAILKLAAAHIPRILVNARLSDRSYRRWKRLGDSARSLFARTELCLAQSRQDAERYADIGTPNVSVTGNLKFDVPPPPAGAAEVDALRAAIGNRPVWVAASTHEGEEVIVAGIHKRLKERHPQLLTIVAPRHPERGAAIKPMMVEQGLVVASRSAGEPVSAATDIYLADTLGEFGLLFRVAPIAFLGGSLIPHGGQNPIEPARLETVVLHGPHVQNFAEIYEALDRSGEAEMVADGGALAEAVSALLADPAAVHRRAAAAAAALAPFSGALDRTMQALAPYLATAGAKVDAL
jgi:3-deoxy-D-manno-octulosonic-acid transferase